MVNLSLRSQTLYRQIADYAQKKSNLAAQLQKYQQWLSDQQFSSVEARYCLQHTLELLNNDRLRLTLVGGSPRGKNDLINTLLFDHYGQRVLYTPPGHTTGHAVEIFYRTDEPSCVRLLPIETRRTATTLAQFKRIPQNWITFVFDPKDPVQARSAMSRIAELKSVSRSEARLLGFDCDKLKPSANISDKVDIPAWRYSLVNMDHPLLRFGLQIIDVPGSDVLNNEPELTLNTLPSSQSVLFMLSGDDGIEAEDLSLWRTHIQALNKPQDGRVRVLLDRPPPDKAQNLSPEIQFNSHSARETVSKALKLPVDHVLVLSTKQGLLAKAAQDKSHLQRSNLAQLELLLADHISNHQQLLFSHPVISDTVSMVVRTRDALKQRLYESDTEREHLQISLKSQPQQDALTSVRNNLKRVHNLYQKHLLLLRSNQRLLERHKQTLIMPVKSGKLEQQIVSLKKQLSHRDSTLRFSQTIATFFTALSLDLYQLTETTQESNRVLSSIYQRTDHSHLEQGDYEGMEELPSRYVLDLSHFQQQLTQLKQKADYFHLSMGILTAEKKLLSNRFVQSLVESIRALYQDIHQYIDHWCCEALALLTYCTQYDKQLLEKHMVLLVNLHNRQYNVKKQLHELRCNIANQEAALFDLDRIFDKLDTAAVPISKPSVTNTGIGQQTNIPVAI